MFPQDASPSRSRGIASNVARLATDCGSLLKTLHIVDNIVSFLNATRSRLLRRAASGIDSNIVAQDSAIVVARLPGKTTRRERAAAVLRCTDSPHSTASQPAMPSQQKAAVYTAATVQAPVSRQGWAWRTGLRCTPLPLQAIGPLCRT